MSEKYIGLMSGTSLDGIDVALMDFSSQQAKLLSTHYVAYDNEVRQQILDLCTPGQNEIERLGETDILLANQFAAAVNTLLQRENLSPQEIRAIGSHGQTIRHYPNKSKPFTLQIGDPNTIALLTGITTIADFRRKDMASGGQGAPLVPAFHQYLVQHHDKIDRAIVNIGGIANVTLITKDKVIGFDTGPGNLLMDAWIVKHQQQKHDDNGKWAASGKICENLLTRLLNDDYFALPPPKSTGREYFNLNWLQQHLTDDVDANNVQATLAELTARSILNAINNYLSEGEIVICGGGAHNQFLVSRLKHHAGTAFQITTTEKYGIHPDWIEASAFAWLAHQTLHQQTGNLPAVTGAKKAVILGGIYHAN